MWTSETIAKVLGKSFDRNDQKIYKIHNDSRLLNENDCFIALDKGHDYLKSTNALTIGEHDADIIVEDSYKALLQLAEFARQQSPCKRIAITGSVGKTTTKHFLEQILSQVFNVDASIRHPEAKDLMAVSSGSLASSSLQSDSLRTTTGEVCNVVASQKSYNNHIGVPLTLTRLTPETQIGIFELGTNNPGEIEYLTNLVKPDISILTNISQAHIGKYVDGLQGIINEKFSIAKGLKGPFVIAQDVQQYNPGYDAIVANPQKLDKINAPMLPDHHKNNLVLVLEILDLLGIDYQNIDFSKVTIPSGRGVEHNVTLNGKTLTFIDDAYNAPFLGMKAALTQLAKSASRKVAILGDMGELGDEAYSFHQQILDHAHTLKIDQILPFGKIFAELLNQRPVPKEELINHLKDGDVVLFKGSNASGLQRVIQELMQ